MSHSLFISDLHLSHGHPRSSELFLRFTANVAPKAEALFILGDLFEYWVGDDDLVDPFHQSITDTLRNLEGQGTRIYIMHGNRDFLMDKELGSACNATLLDDPTLMDLYGTPTLLTHGDALCTDDTEYQRFRDQVRKGEWQTQFLSQPLEKRRSQVEQMRIQSELQKSSKKMVLMDVNGKTVDDLLRQHNYPRLIHGHTHLPFKHIHNLDEYTCERWVLGDWDSGKAAILKCDSQGLTWIHL